jgi:hypothetical protein
LLSLCHFFTRSLGFLELFSNSPFSVLATSHGVKPSAWPSQEPSDLSGLKPDGPPGASLVLSAFGPLSQGPAWLSWEPSDLSGLDPGSPPWTSVKLPLSVFLGWYTYILLCIYCIFCIPTQFSPFSFIYLKHSVQMVCFPQPSISTVLLDNCLIIVRCRFNYCSVFLFHYHEIVSKELNAWQCRPRMVYF